MKLVYQYTDETDIEPIFQLSKALIDKYEDIDKIDYQKVLIWVRQKIENHIHEYSCIILHGEKVGYYFFHEVNGKMEIDDLYIFPKYRNMGIGTAILEKCFIETKLPISLYVFKKNKKAVDLYLRLGFEIMEVINDTRYIMQRD